MNRSAARQAVLAALTDLGLFDAVFSGAPETFGGAATVAIVQSSGTQRAWLARGLTEDSNAIAVGVYVKRAVNGGPAAEDTLDVLAAAVIAAIDGLDDTIVFQRSDAGAGGAPNRRVDGAMYRYERITFTILDEVP